MSVDRTKDTKRRPWSISTRLLAPLLAAIGLLMAAYGWWFEQRQERFLVTELQRDVELFARSFSSATHAANAVDTEVLRSLVVLAQGNERFQAFVYDEVSRLRYPRDASGWATEAEVRDVIASGVGLSFVNQSGVDDTYFVLSPIVDSTGFPVGAVELHAPMDAVRESLVMLRLRFVMGTLVLFLAVAGTLGLTIHRVVVKPLRTLHSGIQAVSAGQLSHTIVAGNFPREVLTVSDDFNRMAARLRHTQDQLESDTKRRIALEKEVHRNQQLAAVGTLASGLAHQIAAPLNVIAGRTELVLQRISADTDRRDLQIALRQIDRITKTVRRLLDIARRPAPVTATVSLQDLVLEAIDFLKARFVEYDIDVQVSIAEDLTIEVDRAQMVDVLEVLLVNALEALKSADDTRTIEITAFRDAASIDLNISDSGPGFEEDTAHQIFDPFYSTKEGGTGLGLMMARHIVEAHGGRITATNRQHHRGATFCVSISTEKLKHDPEDSVPFETIRSENLSRPFDTGT